MKPESGADIRIVRADFHHVAQIAGIEKETFSTPWPKKAFTEEIRSSITHFYVAESRGDDSLPCVHGYIIYWVVLDEMQILNIAVSRHKRRLGIGQRLMETALKDARSACIKHIFLEVRRSNIPALHFYEKNGFQVVGVRKGYYSDNGEDAMVMERYLGD